MSKATESKEIFSVCKQNVNRYFDDTEKNVAQYLQAVTNLQQECATACKNTIETAISVQQEFAAKSGLYSNVPSAYLKMLNDATEEVLKTGAVQNKAALAAIDAIRQNVKTFNDNAKAFSEMNANVLQSWFSTWTPARN
jgi:heterodisulfide reductase subunit C